MMVSKLLSSVLDKVSEDNNAYRMKLRDLNRTIDEKTTSLVGDVVTLSNYTVDFSNAVTNAKDKLVNPISRIIESYVIRDLRSVETVNEQFIDKINDKIDGASINSSEEKDNFIQNLNLLLNDKYLEIVQIKRVDFLNDGVNDDVESAINDFVSYLKSFASFDDQRLEDLMVAYKNSLYDIISITLNEISKLYLDNFVSEITSSLNVSLDVNVTEDKAYSNDDSFRPYIPDINPVLETEIPPVPEIPVITELEVPEVPTIMTELDEETQNVIPPVPNVPEPEESEATLMDIPPIAPIEIVEEKNVDDIKKPYDVEEILKIAKSPVVTMPVPEKKNEYLSVSPIVSMEESDTFDSEFDEKEIVEEMIARLTKRLASINERQEKYNEEKRKLEDDENFVNDLISSSNAKKEELDKFEEELNNKEKEIEEKQRDLDKKINDVLPFADAIMKSEKEA